MIYRIFGAAFLILSGLTLVGIAAVPSIITGVCALVAGIALAAGF